MKKNSKTSRKTHPISAPTLDPPSDTSPPQATIQAIASLLALAILRGCVPHEAKEVPATAIPTPKALF